MKFYGRVLPKRCPLLVLLGGSRPIDALLTHAYGFARGNHMISTILSPDVRCCQGDFRLRRRPFFPQKALQSHSPCGILNVHGRISRKIE